MPERVKEQILEIRATGETNMFDLPVVQRMAYERDFFEQVIITTAPESPATTAQYTNG
ncbi:MAG: DUF5049 domain-containing protein [Sarcina sp.]|nr:DUF5049 domain-containing protein [Sarcina sp.]